MLAKGIGDDFGAAYPTARALLQMGYAIQRAGHGGSLWVLPAGRALPEGLVSVRTLDERGTSLFGSLPLARQGDSVVGNLSGQTQPGFGAPGSLALSESLDALARLASVDGAVLLNMNLNVLGFAAMGQMDVPERLRVWTNVEIQEQAADQLGGGRHRSAYAFVARHRRAAAVVVSEDGPMTLVLQLKDEDSPFSARVFALGSGVGIDEI